MADIKDPENTIVMETTKGKVIIQLFPDVAPEHVKRIKELARDKFYDGIVFHRVIDGFMAQTGDPTGTGMGGSDKPDLKAEFSNHYIRRPRDYEQYAPRRSKAILEDCPWEPRHTAPDE